MQSGTGESRKDEAHHKSIRMKNVKQKIKENSLCI